MSLCSTSQSSLVLHASRWLCPAHCSPAWDSWGPEGTGEVGVGLRQRTGLLYGGVIFRDLMQESWWKVQPSAQCCGRFSVAGCCCAEGWCVKVCACQAVPPCLPCTHPAQAFLQLAPGNFRGLFWCLIPASYLLVDRIFFF